MKIFYYTAALSAALTSALFYHPQLPPAEPKKQIHWVRCSGGKWCKLSEITNPAMKLGDYYEDHATVLLWQIWDGKPHLMKRSSTKDLMKTLFVLHDRYSTMPSFPGIYISWTEDETKNETPWNELL